VGDNITLEDPFYVYGTITHTNGEKASDCKMYIYNETIKDCVEFTSDTNARYQMNIDKISNVGDRLTVYAYTDDNKTGKESFLLNTSELFKQIDIVLNETLIPVATVGVEINE